MRSALIIAALLASTPSLAQVAPDPGVVTAEKTATTNYLADLKAAAAYTSKTRATTRAANAQRTEADLAALIAGAQAIVSAQTVAAPPPVIVPSPPANSVTVANIADLNAALKAATAGETITLAAGTYSGLNASNLILSSVTLTSADPVHPATLTGFYLVGSSGLTFSNLVLSTEGSTDPYPFRVGASSNITFANLSVHGSLDGNPQDDMTGLWIGNGSDHVTVKGSEFQQLANALTESNSTNILIDGNSVHDIGTDGIDNAGSSNVTITNNHFRDFYPASGAHPDAIQNFSAATSNAAANLVVTGNLYERGKGQAVQGVFLGDTVGTGLSGITISGNTIVGGLYNGVAVGYAKDVAVTGNMVLQYDDQPSWIVLRGLVGTVTATGNQASQVSLVDGTTLAANNNTVIGSPTDKGASAIAAWLAAHPATYGIQGAK